MSSISIYLARFDQYQIVRELLIKYFQEMEAYQFADSLELNQPYYLPPDSKVAKLLTKLPISDQGKGYRYYVLESRGQVQALLFLHIRQKALCQNLFYGFVEAAFTLPAYRKQGRMSKLLARVRQDLWQQGISQIELHIAHGNNRAENFWRKCGFITKSQILTASVNMVEKEKID